MHRKADETLETIDTCDDFARHISNKFGDDVYDATRPDAPVYAERKVIGGPAPQEVTRQISVIKKFVSEHKVQESDRKRVTNNGKT